MKKFYRRVEKNFNNEIRNPVVKTVQNGAKEMEIPFREPFAVDLAPGGVKLSGLNSHIPEKRAATEQAQLILQKLGKTDTLTERDLEGFFLANGTLGYKALFDAQSQGFKDTYNTIVASRQEVVKVVDNSVAVVSPVIINSIAPIEEPVDSDLQKAIRESLVIDDNQEENPEVVRAIEENLKVNAIKAAEKAVREKQEKEDAELARFLAQDEDGEFAQRLQTEYDSQLEQNINKQVAIAAAAENNLLNNLNKSNLDSIANMGNHSGYNAQNDIDYDQVRQELLKRIAKGEKIPNIEINNVMTGWPGQEIAAFACSIVGLNNQLILEEYTNELLDIAYNLMGSAPCD